MSHHNRQAHYQKGKYVFIVAVLYTFMLLKGKMFIFFPVAICVSTTAHLEHFSHSAHSDVNVSAFQT